MLLWAKAFECFKAGRVYHQSDICYSVKPLVYMKNIKEINQ
jgi:hypothetical protein